MKRNTLYISILFTLVIFTQGCSPEVGTKGWCEDMEDTPKVEWTLTQSQDYAASCLGHLFKQGISAA